MVSADDMAAGVGGDVVGDDVVGDDAVGDDAVGDDAVGAIPSAIAVSGTRRGFTLVEAVVALTLLSIGLLGAMATQSLAARLLREAEARAGAVNLAGAVLDSLLVVTAPTGGVREEARYRARWRAEALGGGATRIELEIEYHDGTAQRRLHFGLVHLAPLPRIGGGG